MIPDLESALMAAQYALANMLRDIRSASAAGPVLVRLAGVVQQLTNTLLEQTAQQLRKGPR